MCVRALMSMMLLLFVFVVSFTVSVVHFPSNTTHSHIAFECADVLYSTNSMKMCLTHKHSVEPVSRSREIPDTTNFIVRMLLILAFVAS